MKMTRTRLSQVKNRKREISLSPVSVIHTLKLRPVHISRNHCFPVLLRAMLSTFRSLQVQPLVYKSCLVPVVVTLCSSCRLGFRVFLCNSGLQFCLVSGVRLFYYKFFIFLLR